ncbi:ABC transporter permease [Pseudoroseicyclus aestuarii]|uniref:Osmoprotectant transport system permease protein n=1 Tax=Pseudoroseicyclus aestuarii TaxID=1795041 RepID=A0A318T1G0_9RHOB|nr:ABC transporter permease [Pseudoroseicyclus aestuarii]PYE85817.1 osmoprotectant transport system permease protein [Pseudoroseicyclus aestuarii]
MTAAPDLRARPAGAASAAFSPPGVLFAVLGLASLALPFVTLRANRIVLGEGLAPWAAAPGAFVAFTLAAVVLGLGLGVQRGRPWLRFGGSLLGLAGIVTLLALALPYLLEEAGDLARVSPAAGFWCLALVLMLLMADALSALRPGPWLRLGLLVAVLGALGLVLASGALDRLSIMLEYRGRADAFAQAAWRHVALSIGSLAAAAAIAFPLGIACHRSGRLRRAMVPLLSFVQTIPSLAMFGIMIPLLAWVAATVPGAREVGIAGIGFAPAFLALLLYSLLPVVANTLAGLDAVPPAAREAATGMGMTALQRLRSVELPLALPVMLAGLRIVLVQNIGLAVIAGLIGGGGFGTFVFQGLNQTATDLILLGALPTVVMALSAAIVMDVAVELTAPGGTR